MMKVTQLVDRFGSNRMNAAEPAKLLRGCTCIAVPFSGGMCEVPHMTANVILVNDLDRHVINLAQVLAKHEEAAWLIEQLTKVPFHPDVLLTAQKRLREREAGDMPDLNGSVSARVQWALDYFVASWMTRGGKGGTRGEFDAGLSIRWKSGGGDSVVRFRNATESLAEWEKVMRRCTFTTLDALDFLRECQKRDIPENGIYCDPPWIGDGDKYTHNIDHDELRAALESFEQTRIVVRYGDCDALRKLYREPEWTWNRLESRTQANTAKAEVLLTRNV